MKKQQQEEALKQKLIQMKQYEEALYEKGLRFIAGVDEAGRGPLAGPVVAAAVVLPKEFQVLGIDDSKKLSAKRREVFFDQIRKDALVYGIGIVDHRRIDQINILQATKEAMTQALYQAGRSLEKQKKAKIEHVLFDAIALEQIQIPQTSIVKGDAKSVSIAAASILAKVTRDRMMIAFANLYPYYAFEKNKGYGTKAHYQGIYANGICPIHRHSFLKNVQTLGLD